MPYFDTSVVVAYYLPERLSTRVQEIYGAEIGPAVSDLVELELFAALSLRLRTGDLERTQVERVSGLFLRHLEGGLYTRVPLHAGHYRTARGSSHASTCRSRPRTRSTWPWPLPKS